MNCKTQISTETSHMSQNTPNVPISALKESWNNYLSSNYFNTTTFDTRVALAEYMYEQERSDRVLYHLTTTYKPYENRTYTERDVNKFFVNFYVKRLLHYIFDTSYFNKNRYRPLQPVCFCFVDEHEQRPVAREYAEIEDNYLSTAIKYEFPIRLHHHAVLAAHPETVERLDRLIGTNTLIQFSRIMMTSDVKRCDAARLLYSSKMLHAYPDYLTFPDRVTIKRKNHE